jgi:hypothetical protein
MTTKEDYEFAAKAAGIELEGDFPCMLLPNTERFYYIKGRAQLWNPRFNGNDSQDLMVRLELKADCWCGYVGARRGASYYHEDFTAGDAQSMREAIFRVAVAVGRGMRTE